MIKRILLALPLLVLTLDTMAQGDSVGVYVTATDYLHKKLKYAVSCRSKNHKMRLNKLFGQSFITVFENGKKKQIERSSIFGFHDCGSKDYRFFNNHEYAILGRSDELNLYSREMLQPKGRIMVMETFYYFSNGINDVILPLTINELRFAFPDNWRFHDLVEKQFSKEKSLTHYDTARNEYQLITTYNRSKNYY